MDLSPAALAGAAGADPWALQAQLVPGHPDDIIALAKSFAEAGEVAASAFARASSAHQQVGQSFTNDAAPVLDVGGQDSRSWQLLGKGGDDMATTAYLLKRVGTALEDAKSAGDLAMRRLGDNLGGVAAQWNGLVAAASATPDAASRLTADAVAAVQAAATAIRAAITDYESVLAGGATELGGRGFAPAAAGPGDRYSTAAAAADAALVAEGLAGTDGTAAELVDRGTSALQAIAAQLHSGAPLDADQRAYIAAITDRLGPDGLARLHGFGADVAPSDSDGGAARGALAFGDALIALTNPDQGGYPTVAMLPQALRDMAGGDVDADGHRLLGVEDLPRYEGTAQLLAASNLTPGTEFATQAGQTAIRTEQFVEAGRRPDPGLASLGIQQQIDTQTLAKGDVGSSRMLQVASRNLDASQALVGDQDTRRKLIGGAWQDQSGVVAVLDRATERVQPTAAEAEQNAGIAKDLFVDVSGDPRAWREIIAKGTPVSDELTAITTEYVDAFAGSPGSATLDHPRSAVAVPGGYASKVELSQADAREYLTFVASGRGDDGAVDPDMARVHAAADLYNRGEIVRSIRHPDQLSPDIALRQAGVLESNVDTADFNAAMHAYGNADAARANVFDGSAAGATIAARVVSNVATDALPFGDILKDGIDYAADQVIDGYKPERTAGQEGQELINRLYGDQQIQGSHLIAEALVEADALPRPGDEGYAAWQAVSDGGRLKPVEAFRDGVDPGAADQPSEGYLLHDVARRGPVHAGRTDPLWADSVNSYIDMVNPVKLNPDQPPPEPRHPLDPFVADAIRTGFTPPEPPR